MTENLYVTPCIGICTLNDDVCIACKRTREEITCWTKDTHEERMLIMKRLGFGKRRKKNNRK